MTLLYALTLATVLIAGAFLLAWLIIAAVNAYVDGQFDAEYERRDDDWHVGWGRLWYAIGYGANNHTQARERRRRARAARRAER